MAKQPNEQPVQSFFGLPMRWDRQNMFKNFWNKQDDRLFPPKHFGIGWNINFYALLKTAGLIQPDGAQEAAVKAAPKTATKKKSKARRPKKTSK